MKGIEKETSLAFFEDGISQESKNKLFHHKKLLAFKKGDVIIHKGKKLSGVYLVKSGSLRVFSIDSAGNEKPIYCLNTGEICIFSISCSLKEIAYPAWVTIDSNNAEVFSIPSSEFRQIYESEPIVRDYVFRAMSQRIFDLMSLIEGLSTYDLGHRINSFLVRSCGEDNTLHISHQEIATSLGTAREVVSRHLKKLEQNGYLRLSRMKIHILSPEKLAKAPTSNVL